MKATFLILICALCVTSCAQQQKRTADEPVPVIFDTDIGNDIDDVLALEMLFNYERQHKIDLKAITISKCNPHSIEFVDGYCRFGGYEAMPLGFAYNGVTPDDYSYLLPTLAAEYNGEKLLKAERNLQSGLPEGYKVIRRTLTEADDRSVVIIAVGPMTNIGRLMESQADEISPLTGVELVAAKVKKIVTMAGRFDCKNPEWNVLCDIPASQKLFGMCPVELITSGYEVGCAITYPHESILNDFGNPAAHPLCVAYQSYMAMPYDRETWDLTAAFQAVSPSEEYYTLSPKGRITIDDMGVSRFEAIPEGKQQYMIVADAQAARQALVEQVTAKTAK